MPMFSSKVVLDVCNTMLIENVHFFHNNKVAFIIKF